MILSLCTAMDLHWAALKTAAWAGMLISYSHSGSIATAVEKTFDGNHPCPLCNAIAKSRQTGKKPDFQLGAKIDIDYPPTASLPIPPLFHFSWPAFAPEGSAFSPEPILRPPRVA